MWQVRNCYHFPTPASKWQFESLLWLLEFHASLFTLCMGVWWLQQSLHNLFHCDLYQCMPQTHNTRLYWVLPCKCWSYIICHIPSVLSTVYQEKMVTKQELEGLKPYIWPVDGLVEIQCTKSPDVVKRTAELLAEVGCNEKVQRLKGQWVYI